MSIRVDIPDHPMYYDSIPSHLVRNHTSLKPDLIIESEGNVILAELTSPMPRHMDYWNKQKTAKYERLAENMTKKATICALEVSALGDTGRSLNLFLDNFKLDRKSRNKVKSQLSRVAIECSEIIFRNRDSTNWTPPIKL